MGLYSIMRSAGWRLRGYPADHYSRFLKASEHWSREQMESYRNKKLKNLINHCYENVPYYRRVMDDNNIRPEDIRSAEDLDRLPVLTKSIIRNLSKELLAKNITEVVVSWSKTGGTTGEPVQYAKMRNALPGATCVLSVDCAGGGLKLMNPEYGYLEDHWALIKQG